MLLAVNQITGIKGRQLKPMPMRDRIRRASLDAIPTKNTPVVIDVVDLGVAFGAAYAVFGGVVGGFDVDAVGGAGGGDRPGGEGVGVFGQGVCVEELFGAVCGGV